MQISLSGLQISPPTKAPKIIDRSYFTHEVFSQVGETFSFKTTPGLNMHKWAVLRNSLEQGALIQIGDFRKDPNFKPEHEKNQPQLAVGHLSRYLKMLRLEPVPQNPTVHVDITSLFNEISTQALKIKFPAILEVENEPLRKKQYILPCKQNPKFSQDNLQQDLQGVTNITKRLPHDLVGWIDMYLMNKDEVGSKKIDFEQRKEILAHLEDLCNEKAQNALEILLKNYQNGLVFPDNNPLTEEVLAIREGVTSLDLFGFYSPQNLLSQIATFFPNLKSLKLGKVNDNTLQQLKVFPKLESLELGHPDNRFTSQELANLPKTLKRLSLSSCTLSDDAIAGLKDFEHLEELILSFTAVTRKNLYFLPISLKKLECRGCVTLTDTAIAGLTHCKNLQELDLLGTIVTGKNFELLPISLKKLDCHWCHRLTNNAIAGLTHCENLQELDLGGTKITGENFRLLPISLKKLECRGCLQLTDNAITGLNHCIHLQNLELSDTKVTNQWLDKLPKSIKIMRTQH
jgi:Leucine-rich repeat (LRR) protein